MNEILSLNNLVVLGGLIAAVISDIRFRKVDNRLVVALFVLSLCVQVFLHGFSAVGLILASLATAIVIALPLYLMKIFGGGDFKLLIALSPLLNWQALVVIIATAFIWGAILGVIRTVLDGQGRQLWNNILQIFMRSRPAASSLHVIPFTVAIFFGFLTQLTLAQVGWELL